MMQNHKKESVIRTDFSEKISGKARYIDDYIDTDHYHAKVVRSAKAHARITNIDIPEMPENTWIVRARDVPNNRVLVDIEDQLILNDEEVQYVGEGILIIVAKTKEQAVQLAASVRISYEDLPACFDLSNSEEILHSRSFTKGDPDAAFVDAHEIFEEILTTGFQEHAYIEPQGIIARYENGKMNIAGSMQCPYYIHNALKVAFGFSDEEISVVQATVGGAFGGKEDYPSVVGLQAALASYVTKKPIKLIFERQEDIICSTKRHPAYMTYRTALSKEGDILGMDINIKLDGGAYLGISTTVIERSILHCLGAYVVDNLKVHGTIQKTNNVVSGAFRGFGDPQSLFGIETHMSHLARHLKLDPIEFKKKYLAQYGDRTASDGVFRDPVPIGDMLERVLDKTDYYKKQIEFASLKARYRRGIGISIIGRGCGFAGDAERDILKPYVWLKKHADGKVEILVATTDLGQGIHTSFAKVAAETLEIPISRVICDRPNTSLVPNSGPTNASRSMQTVGRLIQRAAYRLKHIWIEGEEQLVEEHYRDERDSVIPWDDSTYNGDAFVTHGWSVTAVEVELDTVTGEVKMENIWGLFDIGTVIDENLALGQMHGGIAQGYGYAALENLEIEQGIIQQDCFSNYIIPTSTDIGKMWIDFVENPYPGGPFGAKGAGEIPMSGFAPAYVNAVENAAKQEYPCIPLTTEKVFASLKEGK